MSAKLIILPIAPPVLRELQDFFNGEGNLSAACRDCKLSHNIAWNALNDNIIKMRVDIAAPLITWMDIQKKAKAKQRRISDYSPETLIRRIERNRIGKSE